MKTRTVFQIMLLGLLVLIVISALTAFASGIEIDAKNADVAFMSVNANDIKPPACSAIYLDHIVRGTGSITGTADNDLILGSTSADTIDGFGGEDCILGGSGDDLITGDSGTDVCIGGPGTDTFDTCETEIQ